MSDLERPLNREQQDSEYQQSTLDYAKQVNEREEEEEEEQLEPSNITRKYQFDGLSNIQVWGYSLGHFYNDLCAAVWFNYLLFYIDDIRGYSKIAPYSMLGGQIFDGIATPVVGLLSDKTKTSIGQRTPWYIFGTIVVTCCFLPIFIYQLIPSNMPEWGLYVYMISFPSLFNVGWAAVQISNMSLVPSLTCSTTRRDILNSRRNTFTFVANLSVLGFAGIFFQVFSDAEESFEALAILLVTVGLGTTSFFMYQVREVPLVKRANECQARLKQMIENFYAKKENPVLKKKPILASIRSNLSNGGQNNQEDIKELETHLKTIKNPKKSMNENTLMAQAYAKEEDVEFEYDRNSKELKPSVSSMRLALKAKKIQEKSHGDWKQWFSESMFYICGVIYMFARLYCNVMASFLPYYLKYICQFIDPDGEDQDITKLPFNFAVVPMLLYLFSTGASSGVETMFSKIGRKKTYYIGAAFAMVSSVIYLFIKKDFNWLVYPTACISGVAQALCLNTAITLISDVIGCRGSQGAFVFGVYSFLDKFLTGIVLFILTDVFGDEIADTSRYAIAIIPAVAIIIAGVGILFIQTNEDGFKHGDEGENGEKQENNSEIKQLEKELAS